MDSLINLYKVTFRIFFLPVLLAKLRSKTILQFFSRIW